MNLCPTSEYGQTVQEITTMRKSLGAVLALVLVMTACTNNGSTTPSTLGGDATATSIVTSSRSGTQQLGLFAAALFEFDSCDAFLSHIKAEASERVGPYGLPGMGFYGPQIAFAVEEGVAFDSAAQDGVARAESAPVAGQDFSTTNVQEVGVDEPDIVKTDGNRILAIAQSRLHYIDVSSGEPVLTDSIDLPRGWNQELLLSGDTAVVMATASRYDLAPRLATGMFAPDMAYSDISVFAQLDLSDPSDLRIVDSLYVDGRYISARMVGDTARVAFSSAPVGLDFVQPAGGGLRGEDRAIKVNREVIAESTLENWMPYYILEDADGNKKDEGTLLNCETAYAPQVFSGFSMLSVLTVDLSDGIDPGAVTGVMSGGDTVYASTDNLYVATQRWVQWDSIDERDANQQAQEMTTFIHKFDISDPGTATYEASGEVGGFLLNQFSMSEHEGNLRVASTNVPTWWWWGDGSQTSESRVDVLSQDGTSLDIIGSVGGLGEGEQIFAVRFHGDVGYVVTFRQTDPLYTVDLSDPTAPVVLGELKILGYSSYLHPLGDGLLMGIGQDADEDGRVTGSQVSIFDVSDLSNPVRVQQFTFASGYSEAEYDHRAFLHWAPTGLTVLPVQWWDYDDDYSLSDAFVGAVALDASSEAIVELGTVDHIQKDDIKGEEWYENSWAAQIRRSLIVGDTLFTLSDQGLKGSDLDTLEDTSWVAFGQ
jgi:uncharacterized secreted protein with C-terminal beta-propeller domain